MQKSGGAAIPMQPDLSKIKKYYMGADSFEDMRKLPAFRLFDDRVCDLLEALSAAIRSDKEAKQYPDIVTLGFFCRRGNIQKLKQEYFDKDRLGKGLSFHIAPANVPINFMYSLVTGLLAGNPCIVRVSSKEFVQTDIICRLLREMEVPSETRQYIAVIGYEYDKEITDYFSSLANVRVIWGGDNTIQEIRRSPVPPRCTDIGFADRYSLCVIRADALLGMDDIQDKQKMAHGFYNDTYLFDQNACSSPRLIYWLGNKEDVDKAQHIFWNAVHDYIKEQYEVEPIIAMDKLLAAYQTAIDLENVTIVRSGDNLIQRIQLESLPENLSEYTCPGGSFIEYGSETLEDLVPIITDKYQTLTYFGLDSADSMDWVIRYGLSGIDRIVPNGKASDFMFIWDGYNVIDMMSRKIFYC